MKFLGIIKTITPVEEVNESMSKQTLVLEEVSDRQFKESIAVDFLNDRLAMVEEVKVGDVVTVSLNTRCNASKTTPDKFFNSINGWKIEKAA
jgi:single-strand DNA-binding protein